MSRRLLNQLRARSQDERGAFLILFVLLLVVLLGLSAILMDGGQARASRREAQSISDLAALGGGKSLSNGSPFQACVDAVNYVNTNAEDLSPKIVASTFCAQPGQEVGLTSCSVAGGLAQAKPTFSDGHYTVTVIYPVLDSDISDSHYGPGGAGENDGTPCDRMGVKVAIDNQTTFGKIFGTTSLETSRLAVVKAKTATVKNVPSLWLLDPHGCVSLEASGGATVNVGVDDPSATPPLVPGLITIDSDGTNTSGPDGCGGGRRTVSSTGAGTSLRAIPTTGSDVGRISLLALPESATTCTISGNRACDQNDVDNARLRPQPISSGERATRAPVDWRYNCKSTYPDYDGGSGADIPIDGCPYTVATATTPAVPAYMDKLEAAVGSSGMPTTGSWQRWQAFHSCNPSGAITVSGNWWVDCDPLTIGNGTTITFSGGNVVLDGDLKMSGSGALNLNTGDPLRSPLDPSCKPPLVSTPCIGDSSPNAAFVFQRSGGELELTGGAIRFQATTLIQKSGAIKQTGGAAPVWSPPKEGPFKALSLWSEKADAYTINGGGGLDLAGVFFTPGATPFKITGGGGVAQLEAQFISRQLTISGNGVLNMAPNLDDHISLPPKAGLLIR